MKWKSSYIPGKSKLQDILLLFLVVSLVNIIAWFFLRSAVPITSVKLILILLGYSSCYLVILLLLLFLRSDTRNSRYSEHSSSDKNHDIFEALAEISPVGMGVVSAKTGTFLYCNPSYEQFFGYDRNELLKKKAPEIYASSDDRDRILSLLKHNNQVINHEIQLRRKDGSKFWSISSVKLIRFRDEPAYLGAFIDITKRKNAEESLLKSEQRLKSHLENSPLAIIEWGHDFSIIQWSTEAEKIFGWKKQEVIGLNINELNIIFKDDIPIVMRTMEKLSGGIEHIVISENRNITRQGNVRNCIWYNSVLHDENGKMSSVMSLVEDVTKNRLYEKMLEESEERFRTIAERLPVLLSIHNLTDKSVVFVNEAFEKLFGYSKAEMTPELLLGTLSDSNDVNSIGEILRSDGKVLNREICIRSKDGQKFWLMTSIQKILFMNSEAYLTASINITDEKRAQDEIIKINRILNARSRSSQIMMHSKDEFGFLHEICKVIIEDCGHKMVWIGYARDDEKKSVVPVAYYGFDESYIENLDITWNDTERGQGPTGVAIRTKKPALCRDMRSDKYFAPWRNDALRHGYAASLVIPLIQDGMAFGAMAIYSCETDPFSDSEIDLLTGLAEDLSYGVSFIRLEKSEREAAAIIRDNEQKLKELIATKDKFFNIMAHDLKNPFTSLLGSSELLYENISSLSTNDIRELVMILNASAKSGFAILQNLLDWSRSQTGQIKIKTERINIRSLVEENITSIMLQALNKNIAISVEIPDNFYIISDRNMINTAIRNLLANAVKYSYKSGRISVSSIISGDTIVLIVDDNGTGIPAGKIQDLFRIDVSYSVPGTELEQGTGLGLKLCKEFIEKLGGKIWAESTEGKGSKFSFSIPINCEFAQKEQLTEI